MIHISKVIEKATSGNCTLACVDLKDWDGQYPAYFSHVPKRFREGDNFVINEAFLFHPRDNCPSYLKHFKDGVKHVWVPMEHITSAAMTCKIHTFLLLDEVGGCQGCRNDEKKEREALTILSDTTLANTIGAQRVESALSVSVYAPDALKAWSREVRRRAMMRAQKRDITISCQGDYIED